MITWLGWGWILAPPSLQGLLDFLRLSELQLASLFGNGGAFGLRLQLGNQLGDELAGLLWVEVASFFGDIDKGSDHFIVALLGTLSGSASGSADLDGQLFAVRVADKFARLLLNVLCRASTLVDGLALLRAVAVANLFDRFVAFLHRLVEGLLLEGDLARFLKVLFAHFFLGGVELREVGVVALLDVLVGALQDRILLERGDLLVFFDAAEAGVRIVLTAGEVDPALDFVVVLPAGTASWGQIGQGHASTKCNC